MRAERLERAAIALVPAIALATMAMGLRTGASSRTLGARVYATSPGRGRQGLALRVVTRVDEGGVAEAIRVPALTIEARAGGHKARWQGGSNVEGIAEAWLDLPGVRAEERVELAIRGGGAADAATLAEGVLEVPGAEPTRESQAIAPVRRTGDLAIEVAIYGGRLVPGSSTVVGIHVASSDVATPSVDVEPGLTIDRPFERTAGGWWTGHVTAQFLTASWTITAADAVHTGTWSGALPVSAGAATIDLPPHVPPREPLSLTLGIPLATPRLYVDVVDAHGLDFAATLDIDRAHAGRATVVIPPLVPGEYWLVTSSDAQGAESLTGTTIARAFRAEDSTGESTDGALVGLATLAAPTISRTLALDGFAAPRGRGARARRRGLTIALGALAMATILETWLILRAAGRARGRMRAMASAGRDAGVDALEGGGAEARATGRVAVLVVVTVLGFALLAMLLLDPAP